MPPSTCRDHAYNRPVRPDSAIVVGGGLAGLAAAARLAKGGVSVRLLESRPRLGGRATSFDDAVSGDTVDNCQHVGMGCCTALRQFCDEAGLGDLFRIERELTFIDAEGRRSRFRGSNLPAPLHLASAFAGLKYLTWRDRVQIARGLRTLARQTQPFDGSLADWLTAHRQGERAQTLFWHVVLVSALSETLDRIDVAAARKVFVDGFLSHPDGYQVHLPTRPLDDLYGPPMRRYLESLGVAVETNAAARRFDWTADSQRGTQAIEGLLLRDGRWLEADAYVVAVPPHRLDSLFPQRRSTDHTPDRDAAIDGHGVRPARFPGRHGELEHAPIASVHLWFGRPITDLPHAVLVEHLSQWVFARPPAADGLGHYYQVVISASRDVLGRPQDEVIAEVVDELRSVFPDARGSDVLRSRMVVEKRAVFSVTPGSQSLRPSQRTAFGNVFLAGDYTRTGWPATMEGAVRSGELAAAAALDDEPAIPPDLPRGRLARWFIGGDREASVSAESAPPRSPSPDP